MADKDGITLLQAVNMVFPVKDAAFSEYMVKVLTGRWEYAVSQHPLKAIKKLHTKSGMKLFRTLPTKDATKLVKDWAPWAVYQLMRHTQVTIEGMGLQLDKEHIELGANAPYAVDP